MYFGCNIFAFWSLTVVGSFLADRTASIEWTEWKGNGSAKDTHYIYYWSNHKATWTNASRECNKNGWQLAKIDHPREDDFLRMKIRKFPNATSSWIGLNLNKNSTKELQSGTWSDGSSFVHDTETEDFVNWQEGEPKTQHSSNLCVTMWDINREFRWDDIFCDRPYKFICQDKDARALAFELPALVVAEQSTTKSMKEVAEKLDVLLSSETNIKNGKQLLQAVDSFVSTFQGENLHISNPSMEINIRTNRNGDSFISKEKNSSTGLLLNISRELVREALSKDSVKRTSLKIASIIYKKIDFFKINSSRYATQKRTTDGNATVILKEVPSRSIFSEKPFYQSYPTVVVGRTISSKVTNITMKALRNPVQVKGDFVCEDRAFDLKDYRSDHKIRCVFWDISENDWSDEGCKTTLKPISRVNGSKCYNVTCECNHMTHFSIVFDSSYTFAPKYLDHVTRMSCIVGGLFLLVACISILSFRRMRNDTNKRIIFNISLNLFLFNVMFLAGLDDRDDVTSCKATSFLLHFFTLNAWFWMLVESVYLLFALCLGEQSSGRVKKVLLACGIVAYGVPALIASITLGLVHPYLSEKYCWIQPTTILYSVILPIGCILVMNVFVGMYAMRAMTCAIKIKSAFSNSARIRQGIRRIIYLTFLLGLPWISGLCMLLSHNERMKNFFALLFTIFITLQGIIMFTAFCLSDDSMRNKLRSMFNIFEDRLERNSKSEPTQSTTNADRYAPSTPRNETLSIGNASKRESIDATEIVEKL